jgi:hypothetical protein
MAVVVLKDAFVSVGGQELSSRTNSVTLNYEIDSIETTSFGDTGHKFIGGLQNVSCEISLQQDYAATNVEVTLYPLVGTTTTVIVKPVNTTTSSTPSFFNLGLEEEEDDGTDYKSNTGQKILGEFTSMFKGL